MFDFKDKYTAFGKTAPVAPVSKVDVGALVFLKSLQVTSSSSLVDFTYAFDTTYDSYVMYLTDVYFSGGGSDCLGMQMFIGGSLQTGANHCYMLSATTNGGIGGISTTTATYFRLGASSAQQNYTTFNGVLNLPSAGSTTISKGFYGQSHLAGRTSGGYNNSNVLFNGSLPSSEPAITGLRFGFMEYSSAMTAGKFVLYGIRKSTVQATA